MTFVIDQRARPRILVRGKDGPAFLHRLSTQHVSALGPGESRLNAFTTDKGRIKDVVHHAVLDADTILLVGHVLTSDDLAAWLDRYCFSEQATFEPLAGSCVLVDAGTADAHVPGAAALAPWGMARAGDVVALRTFDRQDAGSAAVPAFLLLALGDGALPPPHDDVDDAAAAMAAGIPLHEMSEVHTPLDLELHDAIHWAKGCYIGQEVIARLDTYGKQRKRVVGVVVDSAAVGDEIVVDGATLGTVSSAIATPLSPTSIRALSLVKLGAEVTLPLLATLRTPGGSERPATLVARRAAQVPHE